LVLFPQEGGYANLVLQIKGADLPKTLAAVESTAERVLPNTPYRSFFLDQAFDRLYAQEIRMQKTIAVFAILAIALACLGLFGLASFSIERRTKEVGIRKVMGASTFSLVRLHVREYANWIVLANLFAWPVALFLSRNWLAGFVYRTSLPWWLFVGAGLATFVLALATVIVQTTRAATANPVESLRYE
jgi:putative ABC transport system permease protein